MDTKFARFCVLTNPIKFGVETTPRNDAELRYPSVPNPITVEFSWFVKNPAEIKGVIEEANSAGSINVLTYLSRPAVVLTS